MTDADYPHGRTCRRRNCDGYRTPGCHSAPPGRSHPPHRTRAGSGSQPCGLVGNGERRRQEEAKEQEEEDEMSGWDEAVRRDLHPDRHMLHKRGLSRRQRPDLPGGHVQMPTGSEPVPRGLRHDTDVPGAASALQRGNVLFWPMRVWRLPARCSGDAVRSHRFLRTWSRVRGLHLSVYVVLA